MSASRTWVYLGSFPPPYGGATKKNDALYRELSKYCNIKRIDFSLVKKRNVREAVRLVCALLSANSAFVIGISGAKTRRMLTFLLHIINPKAMARSILVVMGGVASKQIAADAAYRKAVEGYKQIFVETKGMLAELNDAGVNNASIYPNARPRIELPQRNKPLEGGRLRCVFFAQVSHEKGYDVAVDAVEILAQEGINIHCDLFGKIPDNQIGQVTNYIDNAPHCRYCGIFKGTEREIISLLSSYDLLLFPSRWHTEGVPGTLIESLIAGTPCIVPNRSYNADVIMDGHSGVVVPDPDPLLFAGAMRRIEELGLLESLSHGAREASEQYFMDKCLPTVLSCLFE